MRKNTTTISDIIDARNIIAGTMIGSCLIGLYGIIMLLH